MLCCYLLVFAAGLAVGFFLNVCISSFTTGESVKRTCYCCDACGTRLDFFDLIPVISYMASRGRCRYCGNLISLRYPAVELITSIVFLILFRKYGFDIYFLFSAYLMSILIAVFFIDIYRRIIPDQLVVAGLSGGIPVMIYNLFKPIQVFGDRNWWNPVLGGVAGSGFLFLIALLGFFIYKGDDAMGMGDVKILAPIGIFVGWRLVIIVLLAAIFSAGVTSIFLLLARIKGRKGTIPFGPYIAAGTLFALVWGWEIINLYYR